jgi:hypothetical protein
MRPSAMTAARRRGSRCDRSMSRSPSAHRNGRRPDDRAAPPTPSMCVSAPIAAPRSHPEARRTGGRASDAVGGVDHALRAGRRASAGRALRNCAPPSGIPDTGHGSRPARRRCWPRPSGRSSAAMSGPTIAADLTERFRARSPTSRPAAAVRHAVQPRIVDPGQRIERGECQKESCDPAMAASRSTARAGPACRGLDHVEPDVRVRVVEASAASTASGRCVGQAPPAAADRIDLQRSTSAIVTSIPVTPVLQRAVEDAEVAVAVAQRRDQRIDERGIAPTGQGLDRGSAHLPTRRREPHAAVRSCRWLPRGELFDRAQSRAAHLAQLVYELLLALTRSVTSSTVMTSPRSVPAPQGADRHALLHALESLRRHGRRARMRCRETPAPARGCRRSPAAP